MLNLGILAHVDAGKTSLTERLLFDTGAIPRMGAVDDATTQTDTMALERRRGITIRSSVATFTTGDHEIHLIDTPGHPDFIAEVERALGVLDGAVLVVSAVEGVQAQTRVLMRTLAACEVPTVVFVNKIDRAGARGLDLLPDLRRFLSPSLIALSTPSFLGTSSASVAPRLPNAVEFAEILSEHSDAVLESYLYAEKPLDFHRELVTQAHRALVHPVFFGSAITGAGIDELLRGITSFLPAAAGADREPLDGTVFAMERDGGRAAVVRLFTGTLGARDSVTFSRRDSAGTVVRSAGKATLVRPPHGRPDRVGAGGIAYVTGLRGIRVGDRLGSATAQPVLPRFRPPTMETVVTARNAPLLFRALSELADQDPLINVRRGRQGELTVSLYGEVQQEVIAARLSEEYGVDAEFSAPRVVCVERPVGVGHWLELIGKNRFAATVGLRIEPGPVDSGVRYQLAVERGSLPRAFLTAIEETVHATLHAGLHGWQVVDCLITLTHTGYSSAVSTAGDFRNLTPLVLMAALREAGTVVCEPWDRVEFMVPADSVSPVLAAVVRCGGLPDEPSVRGLLTAIVPSARVRLLERLLPDITGGSGVLTSRFAEWSVSGGDVLA
jgi:ribosomal protection tetracycline resistance protein